MKITDLLEQNEKGFSVEFFPPKSEKSWQSLEKTVGEINKLKPLFYSITETGISDTEESKLLTMQTLQRVQKLSPDNFTLMPHFTCYGLTPDEIDKTLKTYQESGVNNILALRGDNTIKKEEDLIKEGRFTHANELVSLLSSYDFSTGIAVYPETHLESTTVTRDREDTARKIRAGAPFAITQLFFDNNFYYDFQNWVDSEKLAVTLIPGILIDFGSLVKFCHRCGTSIPQFLMKEIAELENDPQKLTDFTIDFVSRQIKDLQDNGVKYFHLYSLNKYENITRIITKLTA